MTAQPHLRIRTGPTTATAIVGHYPNGTLIDIECETTGEDILGNDTWDRTDRGFVSDRYVDRRSGTPGPC